MTLPSSGQISFSDLNSETGQPPGYSASMAWVKANAKTAVNGSVNVIDDMNTMHNLAYYQSNNYGNCNNGNCTSISSRDKHQCNT